MTAAELARLGRITGFDVEYDDVASLSRKGVLVDADSEVDLYRSAAAGRPTRWRAIRESPPRSKANRVVRARSSTACRTSRCRGSPARSAFGSASHRRTDRWETLVEWPADTVVASVGLGRADSRDVHAEVLRLAAALKARIRGVLAGTVHDKP